MPKNTHRVADLPRIPEHAPKEIKDAMHHLLKVLAEDEAKRDAAALNINKETGVPSEEDINSFLGGLFSELKKDIQNKESKDKDPATPSNASTELHPVMNYITPSEAVTIMNHITDQLAGPLKGEGKPYDAFKSLDFLITQIFSIASEASEIRDAG